MKHNGATIIASICVAGAIALAVPPILSTSHGAGHAQPARSEMASRPAPAMWDFQPMTAEMTMAIRTFKNRSR